jgi:hypothetical protein
MMQILGALITVACISGVGAVVDGVRYLHTCLRAWAPPHAKAEIEEDEDDNIQD